MITIPVSTSKGTASSAGSGALFVLFDDVPVTLLPKRPAVEKSATEASDEHGVVVLLEFVKTSFRHPGAMAQVYLEHYTMKVLAPLPRFGATVRLACDHV